MQIDCIGINPVVALIGSINGAIFGVSFSEAEFLSSVPYGFFGRPLNFHESRKPWPSVDANFDIVVGPDFAFGFLVGFNFEPTALHEQNGIVVVIYFDVDFFGAKNGMIVADVFVGHDDFVTFVAYARKGVLAGIEYDATH